MKRSLHALIVPAFSLLLGLSAPMAYGQSCGTQSWPLTAGQTLDVGTVTVENDLKNIYITYRLNAANYPEATFGQLHMWVGNNLANLPTANGAPIPGRFSKALGGATFDGTGLVEHTFTVSLASLNLPEASQLCQTSLYVVTHAEVDLDGNPVTLGRETAFGGGLAGTGKRWWFYDQYPVCCDFGDPEPPRMQTAFAKGTHVWTMADGSNPEGLPSLNLSENRWGWAIYMAEAGEQAYEIWMGAGLNSTEAGVRVGTLYTAWYDGMLTATYQVVNGYALKEVHLYAANDAPTQIAPGQYGHLSTCPEGSSSYTFDVPLTNNAEQPGIWVIAHAVVEKTAEPDILY